MEPTAAWGGPFELQVATNWCAEEAPAGDAQVWAAPAGGLPWEYASIVDIFGSSSCSLQPYPYAAPASSSSSSSRWQQQQLVDYNYYNNYYAAAAQQHQDDQPSYDVQVETYMNSPERLFQERKEEFKDDVKLMKTKMHRYPPSIQALGDRYTVPKVVAIGPYHHGRDHLQKAEKMKHVAAHYCIQDYKKVNGTGVSVVQEMYHAVVSVAAKTDAWGLYDKEVMAGQAGIGYEDDFLPMMFYDACFLAQFMLRKSATEFYANLYDFFESNNNDIAHDIMLLENQIPWPVVEAVMDMCTPEPLEQRMKRFIARWKKYDGFLQDRVDRELPRVEWYYNTAPHLLGLLRFYLVGKRRSKPMVSSSSSEIRKLESMPISAGAIELAEMGIFLTANNETAELQEMGLASKWIILGKLSMAQLSLNDARASWLVNMAALELCTTPDFLNAKAAAVEDSAVCSYLLLLSMLMHREEDVHELRAKGILQGGGLTNKEALEFFTSLQSLRKGRSYYDVMKEIARYRVTRWWGWLPLYKFVYKNWKYIVAVGSAFGGFIGIITALMRLKGAH